MKHPAQRHCRDALLSRSGLVALGLCTLTAARAMPIETGHPELKVTWDNTIRYNVGTRAGRLDTRIGDSRAVFESDYKFAGRGDIVTNRLDLLSELELVYQERYGFRASAAAWSDAAYKNRVVTSPANVPGTAVPYRTVDTYNNGGKYTSYTKRYHIGPSGELLDAFVFGSFELQGRPVNLKFGRHSTYWGVSVFDATRNIAYGQQPQDGLKAATSPGATAKELVLPVTQLSAQAQIAPEFSLEGQYGFEWLPDRLPEGGTYFATNDTVFFGPTRAVTSSGGTTPKGPTDQPSRWSRGNWGIAAKWAPVALDATIGAYYRRFNEHSPWVLAATTPSVNYHMVFPRDVELIGLSFEKAILGQSVGVELNTRRNTALNTSGAAINPNDRAGTEGTRGNIFNGLINSIAELPGTPLWNSGTVVTELSYQRLLSVTKNPNMFNGVGYSGCPTGRVEDGCATRSAWSARVRVTPQWFQVMPGLDLSMPLDYSLGVKGNGAAPGGGSEGAKRFSVGLTGVYRTLHTFSLSYNGRRGKTGTFNPALGVFTTGNGHTLNDRDWVSFTYQTAF